ncbi:MAG: IS91 family transposase [Anaerolineales bacterium]
MTLPHVQQEQQGRPQWEVADVFDRYFDAYRATHGVSRQQLKVVGAIRRCRAAALGAHVMECDRCGYLDFSYNSCRDRHCPKCQYGHQQAWVEARLADLLPICYHHSVFTLPDGELHTLMLYNKAVMYELFFHTAAETLHTFARDPKHLGAEIGFIGILHTWGQTLCYHPHLHFIVTGGGISFDGRRWVELKYGDKFLFPVKAMSKVMRGKFIAKLRKAYVEGRLKLEGEIAHLADPLAFNRFLNRLASKAFVIYNEAPFTSAERVVQYFGQYTHRVAISNYRILDVEGGQVRFRYQDNQDGGKEKVMTLRAEEFMRRFLLHILPEGFKKVRHYGILSSGVKQVKLALARRLLAAQAAVERVVGEVKGRVGEWFRQCPVCEVGRMWFRRLVEPQELPAYRLMLAGGRACFDTS